MGKQPQGARYAAETEQAGLAARQAGLGSLKDGDIYINRRPRTVFRGFKETGYLVYVFEGGLVSRQVGGGTEVFPWARIDSVTQTSTHILNNGWYNHTRFRYTIVRDDGESMEMCGQYQDPERSKRANPASVGARFNALGEAVARRVCAAKLPGARAAVDRGETLDFGSIVISAGGVVNMRGELVPWAQIQKVTVDHGTLKIKQVDKRLPVRSWDVGLIPDFRVLLALAAELRARAPRN